ncbi:hypothetical protein EMCRGX_G022511 [Ephydatia muelleri]
MQQNSNCCLRSTVMMLLTVMDPVSSWLRKVKRLTRRTYMNKGTNWCWHIDGYDKLKHFGFPIHACIDGFSLKIICSKIGRHSVKVPNGPRKYLGPIGKPAIGVLTETPAGEDCPAAVGENGFTLCRWTGGGGEECKSSKTLAPKLKSPPSMKNAQP